MFFGDTMLLIIHKVIWAVATVLIISSSIYFSFKYSFIQFHFRRMFSSLFKKNDKQDGITSMQTFLMTLGSRIGVGSIAGVSLAIYLGGIGTIFWMWISAFLAASSTFSETVLGIVYRKNDGKDYKGGPSYYIKYGLGKEKLGGLYAFLIILSYVFGFVGIQGNTITKSIQDIVAVPNVIVGVVLFLIAGFIIFGGLKKIASFSEKLVPFMTILYLSIAIFVGIKNINMLPSIFLDIIRSAFDIKAFGVGVLSTLIIGIQRGIFSNEAGLGTGSITSSTSSTDCPVSQGYIQMLGIYVTTLLICTATAIIVLTSDYQSLVVPDINGIELTQYAFQYHLGDLGNILLFVSILLFSFATILTGYYDGESSLKYFSDNVKSSYLTILKLISLTVLFLGCILSSRVIWTYVDILTACLAIINIYSLWKLKGRVKEEIDYYNHKKL